MHPKNGAVIMATSSSPTLLWGIVFISVSIFMTESRLEGIKQGEERETILVVHVIQAGI